MEEQAQGGGDAGGVNNGAPAPQDLGDGLGAAHQAMLQGGGPVGFQPYKRPSFFAARVDIDFMVHLIGIIVCVEV